MPFMELEGSLPCYKSPPLVPSLEQMYPVHSIYGRFIRLFCKSTWTSQYL